MKRVRGSRAEELQRWLGWALAVGHREFGIKFWGNWASLRDLAQAARNDRRDFRDITEESLGLFLEEDESGRWEISGTRVRKVPRAERGKRRFRSPVASVRSPKRSRSPRKDPHYKPFYVKATIHKAAADLRLAHKTDELVQESCDADEDCIGYYQRTNHGTLIYIKVTHGTEVVGVKTPIPEILWAKQKVHPA